MLGKNEENFEIPDFYGIEIKTRRSYSKALITLFNMVPMGSCFYEVKRLQDTYGYRDQKDHELKRLNVVVGTEMVKVGIFYFFKWRVDRKLKRLISNVYDRNMVLIDEETYWDFDVLEEKLMRKIGKGMAKTSE